MKRFTFALLLLTLATSPCSAADDFGTSGPLRRIGGENCGTDFQAQRDGACDPPPIEVSGMSAGALTSARVERARYLLNLLRVDAARQELDTAILAAPEAVDALHLRARLLLSRLDLQGAGRDLDAAIKVDPSNAALRSSLAYLHLQRRQLPDALREIDTALAAKPYDTDARWIRALVLIATGQRGNAEKDLDIAVRDSANVSARQARAELYLHDGRYDAASAEADLLLAKRPDDDQGLNIRALAKLGAGKIDDALEDFSNMIGPPGGPYRLPPHYKDFGRLTFQRAMLLVSIGQRASAVKDIEYLLDKGGIRAVLRLQIFLRHHGMPDIALDGKRSTQLDEAILTCFGNAACGRGLAQAI